MPANKIIASKIPLITRPRLSTKLITTSRLFNTLNSTVYGKFEPRFPSKKPKSKQQVKQDVTGDGSPDPLTGTAVTTAAPSAFKKWFEASYFSTLLDKWNSLPFKLRLWLCVSTFLVALGGDYLSEKVFEKAQIREEAERLADLELQKLEQGAARDAGDL